VNKKKGKGNMERGNITIVKKLVYKEGEHHFFCLHCHKPIPEGMRFCSPECLEKARGWIEYSGEKMPSFYQEDGHLIHPLKKHRVIKKVVKKRVVRKENTLDIQGIVKGMSYDEYCAYLKGLVF